MNLKEINEAIIAKSKALHDIFEEAGPDMDMSKVKSLSGDTTAKVEAIKAMNAELDDLGKKRDQANQLIESRKRADEMANAQPIPKADPSPSARKSLGEMVMESPALKNKRQTSSLDVDLKTLFERTAGFAPESVRIPRVEQYAVRPLMVADLLPVLPTSQAAIKYMEETTFTNNAAETAETGTYGEAALAFTERSVPVEKIAVWLPVTDEQLEDVPSMAAYINNRLAYMLEARLDSQILNGNGTPPNLMGTLNVSGIQTQAKGADPTPDAFYKAFTLVRTVGFAEPDVCFMNPADWQDIRLLRTSDGIYIFGSPLDPGIERMWGIRVVLSMAVVANTGIVGAYGQYSALYMRRGLEIKVSDSHDTYFVAGKQAIRADMRCTVVHFRPKAFCKVTGI
jgi:HK97 family phage major capsid protein